MKYSNCNYKPYSFELDLTEKQQNLTNNLYNMYCSIHNLCLKHQSIEFKSSKKTLTISELKNIVFSDNLFRSTTFSNEYMKFFEDIIKDFSSEFSQFLWKVNKGQKNIESDFPKSKNREALPKSIRLRGEIIPSKNEISIPIFGPVKIKTENNIPIDAKIFNVCVSLKYWKYSLSVLTKDKTTESAVKQTLIDSYYNDGISLIPDSEYDLLFAGDPNHKEKPTRTSKMTIKHLIPMLSLKKYKSLNEVPKTITHNKTLLQIRHETPKIDGIAIQVIYNRGTLQSIQTRGNGIFGVDVKSKVENLLPKNLISFAGELYPNHSHLVFRAEVYTSTEDAKLYNLEHRECAHSYLMKKTSQIDPQHIKVLIHSFNPIIEGRVIHPSFETYQSVIKLQEPSTGHQEGIAFHYFTDRDIEIVFTNKSHYTLCNAFKFNQKESVSVVIEEILITYNKIGKECRVAKFSPVILNSKTITKAFLYNDTKTKVGDTKTLYLAGGIIPKLVDY